jgi:hypothetical protein
VLNGVGWLLARAYDIRPNYAAAIVLPALAFALLLSPLGVRQIKSSRVQASLGPEIGRIRARYEGEPAAINRETQKLYLANGVKPLAGCLPALLYLAAIVLLFFVIRGLGDLDPANAGGPKYVPEGTALWEDITRDHGEVSAFGLDLATRATWAENQNAVLGALFGVLGLVNYRVTHWRRGTAAIVQGAARTVLTLLFIPFGIALSFLLPAGLILFLSTILCVRVALELMVPTGVRTRRRGLAPAEAYKRASQKAARLVDRGRAEKALELRVASTLTFLDSAQPSERRSGSRLLAENLVAIMAAQPPEAVELFVGLKGRDGGVARHIAPMVLERWVDARPGESRRRDWPNLEETFLELVHDSPDEVMGTLAAALPNVEPSDAFVQETIDQTLSNLDTRLELATTPRIPRPLEAYSRVARILLNRARTHGDQIADAQLVCALGDMAQRDEERRDEMVARYRWACDNGCPEAGERLAYRVSEDGHDALVHGENETARRCFGDALRLADDPTYRFFAILADLLDENGDPADCVERLRTIGPSPGDGMSFWQGIAYLKAGKPDEAANALRAHDAAPRDGKAQWSVANDARALLASLEADDEALVEAARQRLRARARDWSRAMAIEPWPMLAAVARREPATLPELLDRLPRRQPVPESIELANAHSLLLTTVDAMESNSWGDAAAALARADEIVGR